MWHIVWNNPCTSHSFYFDPSRCICGIKKNKGPNTKEKTKFLELILKSTKTSANIHVDVLLNVSLILVMSMKFYFPQLKVIHETKEYLINALNTETKYRSYFH